MNKIYLYVPGLSSIFLFLWIGWSTYSLQDPVVDIPQYLSPTMNTADEKSQKVLFRDSSLEWGLIAQHRQTSNELSSFLEAFGAGVCILDADQDGWMDVFVVGGSGFTREYGKQAWWHKITGHRLYLNQQGKYLSDKSSRLGQNELQAGMGCSAADLDSDGDTDLVVSGLDGHFIYFNNGSGVFKIVESTGLRNKGTWATQATFADINGDGLLDIYASNFVNYQKGAKTFESNQGFVGDKSVDFEPSLYDPQSNQLFINRGDFKFEEVKEKGLINNALGRSLGAKWHDFNHDGSLDLLVLNGFDSANRLFINNGRGSFSEAKDAYRALQISETRDMVIADLNGNGQDEFFFTQGEGMRNSLLKIDFNKHNEPIIQQFDDAKLTKKDTLYAEHWGTISADLNNDGAADIYTAAGRAFPDPDSRHVSLGQANRFYLNSGSGSFNAFSGEDHSVAPKSSRGVVTVDLNNDGQLELLITNNNDSIQLLQIENTAKQHWLGISFEGGTEWQGAKVFIRTAAREQVTTISYKQNLFSQSDPRLHFGLSNEKYVDEIRIVSIGGQTLSFTDIQSDNYYQIVADQKSIKPLGFTVETSLLSELELISEQELINLARLSMIAELNLAHQLPVLWSISSIDVKRHMLDLFDKKASREPLYLVFEALRSDVPELTVKAINTLKKQELEYSISWLIPLLSHADINVVCAVAETLQFFFEEEEAVVFRKQLTVSPMLKLLPMVEAEKKICLLKALGAAENKRALLALIDLLNENTTDAVVAETIRALGLLRDSSAIDVILGELQKSHSSEVVSTAFIALSRLNYHDLENLMSTHFNLQSQNGIGLSEQTLLFRLHTLQELYENQESVVLNADLLFAINDYLAKLVNAEGSAAVLVQFLRTLVSSQNPHFFQMAKTFTTHKNPQVVEGAIIASFQLGAVNKTRKIEDVFFSLALKTQQNVLENLRRKHSFSAFFINRLVEQYQQSETSHLLTLNLASLMSKENLDVFVSSLLNQVTETEQIKILHFASRNTVPLKNIPQALLKSSDRAVSLAFLFWYYQYFDIVAVGKADLPMRIKLNSIIFDDNVFIDDKIELLKFAALKDPYVANQFFDYYKKHLSTEELLKIIDNLAPASRSIKLVQYLKTLLQNSSSTKAHKLYAAAALPLGTEEEVHLYFH
jgi:HEAT repeat protein